MSDDRSIGGVVKRRLLKDVGPSLRWLGGGVGVVCSLLFFFSSRRRHTRFDCDWSSDVCSSDLSAEEAKLRFGQHLDLAPLPAEAVALEDALGRVLAHDVAAPIDVPPFDRANVDRSEERRVGEECRSRGAPYH